MIDDTGFPKDGSASPCAARQYSGTLDKTADCQAGVSVHLAGEHASCAADWRLSCPDSWDDAALADPVAAAAARRRREQARIPDGIRHREKWRLELEDRRWQYVLAVRGTASAHAGDARPVTRSLGGGPGRPPRPACPGPAASLRQLAIACADQVQPVTWRHGTKTTAGNPDAAMTSHFLAIRVRPANRDIPRAQDGSLPGCWLLARWPPAADEPADYWLSNLPPDTPIAGLVRLAKIRWRVEHDYRELKTGLGLDHFEGRSFAGWHRHVTLAALARAFCTLLRPDPEAHAPG